ncbi:MAG: hypothetical protein K1W10_04975 [Lachnospiraceae bacterium]
MKNKAYEVFVDVWRLAYRYQFRKLDDSRWEGFIADAEKLMARYKGTDVETLFRLLFHAVQTFYEKL